MLGTLETSDKSLKEDILSLPRSLAVSLLSSTFLLASITTQPVQAHHPLCVCVLILSYFPDVIDSIRDPYVKHPHETTPCALLVYMHGLTLACPCALFLTTHVSRKLQKAFPLPSKKKLIGARSSLSSGENRYGPPPCRCYTVVDCTCPRASKGKEGTMRRLTKRRSLRALRHASRAL